MKFASWLPTVASWFKQSLRVNLQDKTTQNSLVVLSGQVIKLALGLISSALLARSLGPKGLAAFAVVGAALMIAITVADFGLSQSAVRMIASSLTIRLSEAQESAGSFARLKLVAGLLVAGQLLLIAKPLAAWLDLPASSGPAMLQVAAVGLLATTLSGIFSIVLQAKARFGALVGSQLFNTGLTVLLMGLLFLAGRLTILPALWVGAITAAAAAVFSFFVLSNSWRRALWKAGALRGSHSHRLLSFSKWLWLSAILTILTAQADLLMVNRLMPSETAGHYALALNLALRADILNQTMYTVLLPAASALTVRSQYHRYLRDNLVRSLLLSLLLLLAVMVAPIFINVVYGDAFSTSTTTFRLLLLVTAFDLIMTPIFLLAFPLDIPRFITAASGLRVAVLLVLGSQLIPAWGLSGAVVAKLAAKGAGALLLGTAVARRIPRATSQNR